MGTSRPSSRRKLLLIVGAVLLLLTIAAGIFAAASGGSGAKASGVSKNMIALIGTGNGVSSYELLTTEGKQALSKEEWVGFVVANKDKVGAGAPSSLVYIESVDDSTQEEGYNVGQKGSVYRVKVVVDTKQKLIDAITITRTSL